MEITINGNAIDFSLDKEETLGQILGNLEIECEKNGMTITNIIVDGKTIVPEDLDSFFSLAPQSVTTLALETMSGSDIVTIINRIGTKMTEHVDSFTEIPVLLQTGNDARVMNSIHAFAQDFESLCQSLPLLNSIGERDTSTIMVDTIPLVSFPSELTPLLGELIEAIKANDTVLIGDIAEYELAPKIQSLAKVLTTV